MPGTGYQALSVATGGLRYPICGLDFTDIFTQLGQRVIEGAQLACEFIIPESGEPLDLATVRVEYGSGGVVETFAQVPSLAACTDDAFYIAGDRITLCPTSCELVRADEDAEIAITSGCEQLAAQRTSGP